MKIYIEDQVLESRNDIKEIDNIFSEIDNIINKSSKILSYMIIDNFEVYQDFYDYFLENIRVIQEVKVIALTYKELVHDILISAFEYIKRVPEKIEELANKFYKNSERQTWNDLNDLLGGITWIINTFFSIDQDKRLKDVVSNYKSWNLYAKEIFALKEILPDLEIALENNDNVTIADILLYEILPIFNEIGERLLELVKMEGKLDDLN
ncbi:hypothetical protein SAMN02745784_02077 [Tissierella praeacuta DSM 18095]|uniref:Uncharacterized protein n=1 Tax=Tissierella praeacuta DSM 18095 TaxID=1123404 RepID=A0A1M4X256_9FIRM|nr:hypothetical protein [Tissierella praeacuta]SHE87447.1 hypothetical protein SAMN02745784_02077 [Tissierella praeacuta DSM 18095]SUO99640.1 Uncharacterised protein [Tissierella praeacuta]